ncbi:hypothetical protein ACFSKN_09780 [Mariniflexile gromovii]|uniref:Lipoprotein n=1 Tax=Mariniflexile gromovii TaxID=362523 RepID=A0ABS4BWT3_9FLAO|nr:hypothetical protein [Mariniflexile gromovii]MBP0905042.1 hypothetical protein [Mariniflexile gromovii]
MLKRKHLVLLMCGIYSCALFFMSCNDDDTLSKDEVIKEKLNEVRNITSDIRTTEKAAEKGWDEALSECVEHPTEGAMGYHIARMEYMDGRVNHKEPQVLLFAKKKNSEDLELVGVEYIVPFGIHPSSKEAPELFFQKFHKNMDQEIWALHVWTERENPKGIFYDWNPDVSCQ